MTDVTVSAVRSRAAALPVRNLVLALGVCGSLVAVAAADGGYFAPAWGWAALGFFWVAAVSLLLARTGLRTGLSGAVLLGALTGLVGWTWLSILWSGNTVHSVLEGQRALVYLSAAAALLLVLRRDSVPIALGSVLAATAVVSAYGLATRLLPDRLGVFDPVATYRLSEPLGYWNGLGIFAAMGALLALAFAARGRTVAVRALAAAGLTILLPTIYFTFSRGAWISLGLGLAAAIAFDRRRLQLITTLLVVAPPAGAAVWLGSRSDALTTQDTPLSAATREGHELALIVPVLAALAGAAALLLVAAERRMTPSRAVRAAFAGALVVVVVATAATVFARYGGPIRLVERGYDAFTAPPPQDQDLRARLFSFSGTYRPDLWEAAWDDYKDNAVLGSGAGTYEQYWLKNREITIKVRDAHSLYVETLVELGPVGLLLLAVALGVPLLAVVKARLDPLVPAALGAYVAYVVHAGVDWDWELPAVSLTGLSLGVAALVAGDRGNESRPISPRIRIPALAVTVALAAVAFVGLVGASALAESEDAAEAGKWERAEDQARKARRWAPWSSEPWQRLGEAQLGQGKLGQAEASFRKAIAKEPNDWELWLDLAEATTGRERRRALAEATRLNPLGVEIAEFRAEELGETPS